MAKKRLVFSIVTASHFGRAVALAKTIRGLSRGNTIDLHCLLIGEVKRPILNTFPGRITKFSELANSSLSLRQLAFKYEPFALCSALKPYFAAYLARRSKATDLIYLDTDILVTSSLEPVFKELKKNKFLLTPHYIYSAENIPRGFNYNEGHTLARGVINSGFFAFKNIKVSIEFLDWWASRTFYRCENSPQDGYFYEQKWLDLGLGYFPFLHIWRHPGCNVAFWNLHERRLGKSGQRFTSNGSPLLFFHFSGWNSQDPKRLSRYSKNWHIQPGSIEEELMIRYRLNSAEHSYCDGAKYKFDRFNNKVLITPEMRALFRSLDPQIANRFGDPFATKGRFTFFAKVKCIEGISSGSSENERSQN